MKGIIIEKIELVMMMISIIVGKIELSNEKNEIYLKWGKLSIIFHQNTSLGD